MMPGYLKPYCEGHEGITVHCRSDGKFEVYCFGWRSSDYSTYTEAYATATHLRNIPHHNDEVIVIVRDRLSPYRGAH